LIAEFAGLRLVKVLEEIERLTQHKHKHEERHRRKRHDDDKGIKCKAPIYSGKDASQLGETVKDAHCKHVAVIEHPKYEEARLAEPLCEIELECKGKQSVE